MRAVLRILLAAVVVTLLCAPAPATPPGGLDPKGPWELTGSNPGAYLAEPRPDGMALRSREPGVTGFGALARTIDAKPFRGQRVELRALIRTRDVGHWSGPWMMVWRSGREVLAFDDSSDRGPFATTDWQPMSVVLEVRPFADKLSFGLILGGGGEVELKELALVPAAGVPTTDQLRWQSGPAAVREALPGNAWEKPEDVIPWLF